MVRFDKKVVGLCLLMVTMLLSGTYLVTTTLLRDRLRGFPAPPPMSMDNDNRSSSFPPTVSPIQRTVQLRVLSYNIRHAQGIDGRLDLGRIAKVILDSKADLVALQEVDQGLKRSKFMDQPALLSNLTGLNCFFGSNLDFPNDGHYGNAVLSRWPIVKHSNLRLPNHATKPREPRGLLVTEIQPPDTKDTIIFLSTHLDHDQFDDSVRMSSTARINEFVLNDETSSRPALLAGDMNAVPSSDALRVLEETWTSVNQKGHPMPTTPVNQIDYILFRPREKWTVLQVQVWNETKASDHQPFLAVLEMLVYYSSFS